MFMINQSFQTRNGHSVRDTVIDHSVVAGFIIDAEGVNHHLLWCAETGRLLDRFYNNAHDRDGLDLVNTPPVYDDAYIEYWGDIYLDRHLNDYGILFDVFLQVPEEILHAIDGGNFEPLLPAQRNVLIKQLQDEVEAALPADAKLKGDGFASPLKHHRYDVSHDRAPNKVAS